MAACVVFRFRISFSYCCFLSRMVHQLDDFYVLFYGLILAIILRNHVKITLLPGLFQCTMHDLVYSRSVTAERLKCNCFNWKPEGLKTKYLLAQTLR